MKAYRGFESLSHRHPVGGQLPHSQCSLNSAVFSARYGVEDRPSASLMTAEMLKPRAFRPRSLRPSRRSGFACTDLGGAHRNSLIGAIIQGNLTRPRRVWRSARTNLLEYRGFFDLWPFPKIPTREFNGEFRIHPGGGCGKDAQEIWTKASMLRRGTSCAEPAKTSADCTS